MERLPPLRVFIAEADARQALPFLRSLRRAGHHVTAQCYTRLSPAYLSRYPHRRVFFRTMCETHPDAYIEELLEALRADRYDVVLPFGHHSIHALVRHRDRIEPLARLPVPASDLWMRAYDKGQTMAFCMAQGIPCPVTYFPETEPVEAILARAALPLWMKPTISVGAIGGRRLNTPDEVRTLLPEFRRRFGPMILQEYVPHEGSQQMVYHTFLDAHARTVAGMLSWKPRYFPLRGGTSTALVSVHRPEIVAYCRRLFEGIGYQGIADIDLIVDPRDGQAKVMEINPRVSCSVKIGFAAGIDYGDMWLRLAMGAPIAPVLDYPAGLVLRNLCQEILWYLFSPRQARRNTDPPFWRFFGRNVFYQTLSADDPLTFLGFVLYMLRLYSDAGRRRNKIAT